MEQVVKRLGRRIRELRIERGFKSQEKFADFCGVDRTFMGHLETGRRDFRLSTIVRVANALDVPVAELFVEPGTAERRHPRRSGHEFAVSRKRILDTAATLEAAARTLKEVAGTERPKRQSVRECVEPVLKRSRRKIKVTRLPLIRRKNIKTKQ